MVDICSSKIFLNTSITLISMFHILPYMMYLKSLVKILLRVMDLNMSYKTHKTSKYTRNSDLPKNREIRFSCYISRSSVPYAPFFPPCLLYRLLSTVHESQDPQNPAKPGSTPLKSPPPPARSPNNIKLFEHNMSRRLLSSSPRQYESASRFWGQLQDLAASASDPLAIMRASPSATKYTRCWRGVHGHSGDATILRPSSQRLLASFLSFANENRIPVVPQSGNTSLVGSAVPSSPHELLLSMDRYPSSMSLDSAEHVMTLDAGVKLQDAIDYADSKGFVFPIDLGGEE